MADRQISELERATSVTTADLFVLEQSNTAKSLTGQVLIRDLAAALDGHGGIRSIVETGATSTDPVVHTFTITFADDTTTTFTVTDGAKGDQGNPGVSTEATGAISYAESASGTVVPDTWGNTIPEVEQGAYLWTRLTLTVTDVNGTETYQFYSVAYNALDGVSYYVHVRWAEEEPDSDSDMRTAPAAWMGIYSGTSAEAPTSYTAYSWSKVRADDYYTHIRYADVYPSSNADMYPSPLNTTVYMGVYTGPSVSAPGDYTAYSWVRIKGSTGDPATVTSTATVYQYSANGTTVPSGTWYSSQSGAASAYGQIQGAYLWVRLTLTWNNGNNSMLYSIAYQGIDGSGLTGVVKSINSTITPDSNGDVTLDADSVGAIAAPTNPVDGNVLIYDGTAGSWEAGTVGQGTVTSVDGKNPDGNGAVTVYGSDIAVSATDSTKIDAALATIPTKTSDITNDSGFITSAGAPVQSVNGATGAVALAQIMGDSGGQSITSYPSSCGRFAVTANIFSNMTPQSYFGVLTIERSFGYQRHVFTSSQGEMYEGWRDASTVSEPSAWSKLLDNRHLIQSDNSVWVGSSYDLNNFFSGVVLCYSNVQHVPSADWWHVMASGTSGTVVQIAAKLQNNGQIMTRRCAGGTWSAWEPLFNNVHQEWVNVAFTLGDGSGLQIYSSIRTGNLFHLNFQCNLSTTTVGWHTLFTMTNVAVSAYTTNVCLDSSGRPFMLRASTDGTISVYQYTTNNPVNVRGEITFYTA